MNGKLVFAIIFLLGMLLLSESSQADFLGRPWACPDLESLERAKQAQDDLDEVKFHESGCVAVLPEDEYRLVKCDQGVTKKYRQRFSYPIPVTDELPKLMCEIVVRKSGQSSRKLLIGIAHIIVLDYN